MKLSRLSSSPLFDAPGREKNIVVTVPEPKLDFGHAWVPTWGGCSYNPVEMHFVRTSHRNSDMNPEKHTSSHPSTIQRLSHLGQRRLCHDYVDCHINKSTRRGTNNPVLGGDIKEVCLLNAPTHWLLEKRIQDGCPQKNSSRL